MRTSSKTRNFHFTVYIAYIACRQHCRSQRIILEDRYCINLLLLWHFIWKGHFCMQNIPMLHLKKHNTYVYEMCHGKLSTILFFFFFCKWGQLTPLDGPTSDLLKSCDDISQDLVLLQCFHDICDPSHQNRAVVGRMHFKILLHLYGKKQRK